MVAIIVGLCRRFVSGLSQACPRLGAGLSGFAGLSVLWGLSPLELFVTVVLAHLSGGVGFVRGLSRLCRGLSCPGFAAVCPGFFRGLSRVSRGLLVSCGFGLLQIRHCRGWRGSVEALSWVCVRRGCCRQSSGGGGLLQVYLGFVAFLCAAGKFRAFRYHGALHYGFIVDSIRHIIQNRVCMCV